MVNNELSEKKVLRPVTVLAIRILLVLFIFLCSSVAFFFTNHEQKSNEPLPTITPTLVVTPQVLVNMPEDGWKIRFESFSQDKHSWEILQPPGKLEIISEKLILQSYRQKSIVIGYNQNEVFDPSENTYYVQADFMADTEGEHISYGLVFGLNSTKNAFYVFDLHPQSQSVRLLKYNSGDWEILVPVTQVEISAYPEATTLSVLVNEGIFELYVNGKSIKTFTDEKPFFSKGIGILTGTSGYRVIVDNFFVSEK